MQNPRVMTVNNGETASLLQARARASVCRRPFNVANTRFTLAKPRITGRGSRHADARFPSRHHSDVASTGPVAPPRGAFA